MNGRRMRRLVLAGAVAGGLWPSVGRASMDEGKTVRGDFNGDGVLETVASEPTHDNARGRVYVTDVEGDVMELHRGLSEVLGSANGWERFGGAP
jgi:hypothetical protein